jgi:hypothetical protein
MIYPEDFIAVVKKTKKPDEKSLMARVALNALYDPERFPVDLSEVMALPQESKMLVRAFMAFCAINPGKYLSYSDSLLPRLTHFIVVPPTEEDEE